MTDKLREAAQAALLALDSDHPDIQLRTAMNLRRAAMNLRAALAEQKPMLEMNPEKRPWVGLTGDEIEDINKDQTLWEIIQAAEEILKEKNCG